MGGKGLVSPICSITKYQDGHMMGRILLVPTLYQQLCAAVLTTYADLAEIV